LTYKGQWHGHGSTQRHVLFTQKQDKEEVSGAFFMAADNEIPQNNRAILNLSHIIKAVLSPAAEVDLGVLFIYAKMVAQVQNALKEMCHLQSLTSIHTHNST